MAKTRFYVNRQNTICLRFRLAGVGARQKYIIEDVEGGGGRSFGIGRLFVRGRAARGRAGRARPCALTGRAPTGLA